MRLLLANVFVPHLRVRPDISAQQGNTLLRIEVDHFHTQRAQPIDSTLKVAALADYNRAKTKLPNQTAAIPAGREGSDHDEVTIAALTAGIAKGVRLTVHGGITLLHAPVVACSDNLSARVTDRRARWEYRLRPIPCGLPPAPLRASLHDPGSGSSLLWSIITFTIVPYLARFRVR